VLPESSVILRIQDRVTDRTVRPPILIGVAIKRNGSDPDVLPDWKVLTLLNELPLRKELMRDASAAVDTSAVQEAIDCAQETVKNRFAELAPNIRVPECQPVVTLWSE